VGRPPGASCSASFSSSANRSSSDSRKSGESSLQSTVQFGLPAQATQFDTTKAVQIRIGERPSRRWRCAP
jgi:hypothetical protein